MNVVKSPITEADRYRGIETIVFATFNAASHPWLAKWSVDTKTASGNQY
jgi:hypothetical protein